MDQISPITALVGLVLTGVTMVATVVYSHTKLATKVDGISARLDAQNGRLNRHSEDLKTQGQRVSRLEGKQEG